MGRYLHVCRIAHQPTTTTQCVPRRTVGRCCGSSVLAFQKCIFPLYCTTRVKIANYVTDQFKERYMLSPKICLSRFTTLSAQDNFHPIRMVYLQYLLPTNPWQLGTQPAIWFMTRHGYQKIKALHSGTYLIFWGEKILEKGGLERVNRVQFSKSGEPSTAAKRSFAERCSYLTPTNIFVLGLGEAISHRHTITRDSEEFRKAECTGNENNGNSPQR